MASLRSGVLAVAAMRRQSAATVALVFGIYAFATAVLLMHSPDVATGTAVAHGSFALSAAAILIALRAAAI